MNKTNIIEIIRKEKPYLHSKFGVEEIGLFGSYARGEEKEDSDVDLLIKFKIKTLANLSDMYDYLQSKLNKKIDIVSKHDRLSPNFLKLVNMDIIYA